MKDITMLVAHPDDEFLFGFPVIQQAKKIIACVDDMTHPTRQWCRGRKDAFKEVCDMVGAECEVLRYDSGFFRLDQGSGALRQFVELIREKIRDEENIFTHNAWGEYGHFDHILLNQIVRQTGKSFLVTDIYMDADWYKTFPYEQGKIKSYRGADNDLDFHNKCVDIYRKHKAFGWTYPPVEHCHVFEVIQ